jgi:CRISPR-associated protein Csd1
MILQALKDYYDRRAADPESGMAPEGFESKEIDYVIVLDRNGKFIAIEDYTEKRDGKKTGRKFILPRSAVRGGSKSYETAFLLWDHIGYVLGLAKKPDEKTPKQNAAFKNKIFNLPAFLKQDEGVSAVEKFYKSEDEFNKAIASAKEKKCDQSQIAPNVSFRLQSSPAEIIPCRKAVKDFVKSSLTASPVGNKTADKKEPEWLKRYPPQKRSSKNEIPENETAIEGLCMITGETGIIKRTHGKTFINADANSLISFQTKSGYDSYGKEQGYNAPIIESTEFAYITALNTLLKTPNQKMYIGGAQTVFWSAKRTHFETAFSAIFSEPPKDDPNAQTRAVKSLFESPKTGEAIQNSEDKKNRGYVSFSDMQKSYRSTQNAEEKKTRFYVLGLSQGGGKRICVRFWKTGTVEEFAENICQHFTDLEIAKPPREPQYYSLRRLLVNAAVQDKSDNIPPNIAGDFMRAVLDGTPYPSTLLQLVLRRIKSDTTDRVKPVRAAFIKAYLNRYERYHTSKDKELEVALDTEQTSEAYHLGRLFAALEKIQEDANPGLNATIRERYYGAACANPVAVFPTLLRLKNHHIAKVEGKGRGVYFYESLLGEIMGHFDDFPAHLDLHKQGKFAIGYYHQRQDFYTSKNKHPEIPGAEWNKE